MKREQRKWIDKVGRRESDKKGKERKETARRIQKKKIGREEVRRILRGKGKG